MEYRITLTLAGLGNEENAELLLDRLLATARETGPVTGANLARRTLDATLALRAEDPRDAIDRAQRIVTDALAAAKLPPTRTVAVEATQLDLQPA